MTINAMDAVCLAVADLDAACRPYERLGLRFSPVRNGRRTLHVGTSPNPFAVHFLPEAGQDPPLAGPLDQALVLGRPLFAVGLRVPDLSQAVDVLAARGVQAIPFRDVEPYGAWLPLHEQAGTDLLLIEQDHPADAVPSGLLDHSFPLRRLDHLAVVTPDLEAKTGFWAEVLGVAVSGEITTPTMVIRQLRIGDAVLELLGPASPESPLWKRPPGLVGMVSWEVADLNAAVDRARSAGFSVTDPAAGPLPGTRIATLPGTDLAGVNMQLLQYV
jgi:methylmalonyl-CoA/ethylmalonyl-CoA epimerase